MDAQCESCKATTFRRSRLKLKDLGGLLSLHYPVRCLACSKRQSVAMAVARRAIPSLRARRASDDGAATNPAPVPSLTQRLQDLQADDLQTKLEELQALTHPTAAMPDLRSVRLPHVAHPPPGDGENLTRTR